MVSHRIRSRWPALKVLAGMLFALGLLAGSASTAGAATGHAASAHHAVSARVDTAVSRAPTSSFVAYTGQDFTGRSHDVHGCGPEPVFHGRCHSPTF